MKRIIVIFVGLLMLVALCSCAKQDKESDGNLPTTTELPGGAVAPMGTVSPLDTANSGEAGESEETVKSIDKLSQGEKVISSDYTGFDIYEKD